MLLLCVACFAGTTTKRNKRIVHVFFEGLFLCCNSIFTTVQINLSPNHKSRYFFILLGPSLKSQAFKRGKKQAQVYQVRYRTVLRPIKGSSCYHTLPQQWTSLNCRSCCIWKRNGHCATHKPWKCNIQWLCLNIYTIQAWMRHFKCI